MHVKSLEFSYFMNHTDTHITLPERGVVVLTGLNGSGKSTLIEGAAYAAWGERLRGGEPWRAGFAGCVSLKAQSLGGTEFCAQRGITKAGKKLALLWVDGVSCSGDTPRKTQAVLDPLVGSLDVWRRTHVFSSTDAAHFSSATDGERKKLIETMLGLAVFDEAYSAARQNFLNLESQHAERSTKIEALRANLAGRRSSFVARTALPAFDEPPPQTPPAGHAPTDSEHTDDRQLLNQMHDAQRADAAAHAALAHFVQAQPRVLTQDTPEITALQATVTDARIAANLAQQHYKLALAGKCQHCAQPYTLGAVAGADFVVLADEALRRASWRCVEAEAALTQACAAEFKRAADADRARRAEHAELTQACTATTRALAAAVGHRAASALAASRHQAALERYQAAAAQHQTRVTEWEARRARHAERSHAHDAKETARLLEWEAETKKRENIIALHLDEHSDSNFELIAARYVKEVLGLRGVRAHILGEALAGIEAVANAWLSTVAPGLEIRLATKEDGDAIMLTVLGVAGGTGYKGASGGERRRIDAAILLAFAEIAAAAHGQASGGTLFLDEIFDAVDSVGVPAIAAAIADLGTRRCVVVITHNEDLARQVQATQRITAVEGAYV